MSKMTSISEVCNLNMGQSPSSDSYNQDGIGIPFFQGNADFGELHPAVRFWCSEPTKIANPNDILISVRAPIGALNIAVEKCCIGRGLAALTAKHDVIDSRYLLYALQSRVDELISKGTGSTFKAISKNVFSNVLIPLPPLAEQRKIAAVLDKANALIADRKRQLEQLDLMVKSRFVEMFGDVLSNDKGWVFEPLEKLCTISRGGSPRPIERYLGGSIPWIKIGDATVGDDIYLHSTKDFIIEEGLKKSRFIKSGSLIFANCGVSLGFARIITFDGCIHDGWLSFEDIDERLNKVFLLQSLNQ
jgi:restriction endonuclease S subunit